MQTKDTFHEKGWMTQRLEPRVQSHEPWTIIPEQEYERLLIEKLLTLTWLDVRIFMDQ